MDAWWTFLIEAHWPRQSSITSIIAKDRGSIAFVRTWICESVMLWRRETHNTVACWATVPRSSSQGRRIGLTALLDLPLHALLPAEFE